MSKPVAFIQPFEFKVFTLTPAQLNAIQTLHDVKARIGQIRLYLGVVEGTMCEEMSLVVCDSDPSSCQVNPNTRFIRLVTPALKIEEGVVKKLPPHHYFVGLSLDEVKKRAVHLLETPRYVAAAEPQ